jgi:hypothetical protein
MTKCLITFKAKPVELFNPDGELVTHMVKIPELTRSHCNAAAFRTHPRWRGLANSDLLPAVLRRLRGAAFGRHTEWLRFDQVPPGVTVDSSGFLAVVSIDADVVSHGRS